MSPKKTDAQREAEWRIQVDNLTATARPTAGTLAAVRALDDAQALVCMVRDEGPDAIGRFLDGRKRDTLYALTTVLACMVPDDRTPEELLAWLVPDPVAAGKSMTPEAHARVRAKRQAAKEQATQQGTAA